MSRAPQANSDNKQDAEYLAAWNATMQLLREGHSFSGRERNCAFLNCGADSRFANVSAISGLDFADDARVIAMVDWDHDGDLDCWLHNRTGPRLRLMQNQTIVGNSTSNANFVSVRLQGTKTNRDAIGARVEILFRDTSLPRLVKTLYAGDAFLSQSSKTLHFGLGEKTLADVQAIRVRWPGGETEDFSSPSSRCLLEEGSGVAKQGESFPVVNLVHQPQTPVRDASATRVLLFNRPPLPILDATSVQDGTAQQLTISGRPTLLVLWASWCPTCKQELQELANQKLDFDVIAVAVDDTATEKQAETSIATIVEEWKLPFPVYSATTQLLDKLELLGRVSLNRKTQLAVPMSFLVDELGRVAAVYRGPAELSTVSTDVATLKLSLAERRDKAVPFAGKWTSPPSTLLMRPVANIFRDRGYTEDYSRFLKIEMDDVKARRATAASDEQRQQLDRQWSGDNFNIAFAHEQQREFQQAADYYRQGLAVFPGDARAWQRLVFCLKSTSGPDDAIETLRAAISKVTPSAELHIELAKLLREKKDFAGATSQLQAAIQIEPESARGHFNLATLLAADGKRAEAEQSLRKAIAAESDHFESLLNLGALMASRGESQQAIQYLRQATKTRPQDVNARLNLAKALLNQKDMDGANQQLQEVMRLDPQNAQARIGLAQLASATKKPVELKKNLQAAIEINPNDTASKLRLAWLLATTPDDQVRDAGKSVEIAQRLNEEANGQHPIILDTLAAAQASAGDFVAAVTSAKKAVTILQSANQAKMAKEVQGRLSLYENKKPFVQSD